MSAWGRGITTAEMQDPNTLIAAEWDFYPHNIWAEPDGGGYPILWWQQSPLPELPTFSGGTGEPNDPYLISTTEDLSSIGHNPRLMQCHFKLMTDLDLAGLAFYEIGDGDYPFSGDFDGNGMTIRNLTHTLFGYVSGTIECVRLLDPNCVNSPVESNYGTITDCYVQGGIIRGAWGYLVGGLVGHNFGSITRSYSAATVESEGTAGGLVGNNGGSISRSYCTGTTAGTAPDPEFGSGIGGLVGDNSGSITESYSTGTVIDIDNPNCFVGGLAGTNGGCIDTCYSTGRIVGGYLTGGLVGVNVTLMQPVVIQSFWDIQTSGLLTNDGGIGKTTAEMQTASTFLDAGWDFVGETANGTEDIWWIDEGKDCPHLWWEPHD
jgi:hypothetical protein